MKNLLLMLFLLPACLFQGSESTERLEVFLVTTTGPDVLCGTSGGEVSVGLSVNDKRTGVEGYSAALVVGETQVPFAVVSVTASEDGARLRVSGTAPPALAAGAYDLVLTRHATSLVGADTVVVANVLNAVAAPVVTAVENTAVCVGGTSAPAGLKLRGTGLGASNVSLVAAGSAQALLVTAEADGTALTAGLPVDLMVGRSYDIVVTPADGICPPMTLATPVTVAGSPVVLSASSWPRFSTTSAVSDSDTSPVDATVTVRVSGQGLSAASAEVSIEGVNATAVTAASGVTGAIDAVFAPGALPAGGPYAVRVGQDGCEGDGPLAIRMAASSLVAPSGVNPTVLSAQNGAVLDVRGDFTSAVEIAVDVDPDPVASNWVLLVPLQVLDREGKAQRYTLAPGTVVMADGSYDVRFVDQAMKRRLTQQGLSIRAAEGPRIVAKDRDWLRHGADSVRLYGCGLAAATGVMFQLVDGAGAVQATLATSGATTSGPFRQYAESNFKCRKSLGLGGEATSSVVVSTPGVNPIAAGVYRLRVAETGGGYTHDDLYPLVIYGDAPGLHGPDGTGAAFAALGGTGFAGLAGRRQPQSVVAYEPLGRKYLYVVGGDANPTPSVNPAATPVPVSSYEYTPLAPDHTLVGFTTNAIGGAKQFNLQCQNAGAGPCAPTGPTGLPFAYAPALVADGSHVYWLGGTSDGAAGTSDRVLMATVSDTSSGAQHGLLTAFGDQGVTLSQPLFGLAAERVVLNDGTRKIFALGGAVGSGTLNNRDAVADVTEVSLAPTGPVIQTYGSTGLTSGHEQAFQALIGRPSELLSFGGYIGIAAGVPNTYLSGPTGTPVASLFTSTGNVMDRIVGPLAGNALWSYGQITAGPLLFVLGGGSYLPSPTDKFDLLGTTIDVDLSVPNPSFVNGQTHLTRRRGLFATAHVAPYAYVFDGVVCIGSSSEDACTGPSPFDIAGNSGTPVIEWGRVAP